MLYNKDTKKNDQVQGEIMRYFNHYNHVALTEADLSAIAADLGYSNYKEVPISKFLITADGDELVTIVEDVNEAERETGTDDFIWNGQTLTVWAHNSFK